METRDLYKVLGVSKGASQEEIRRSYRKLARKHHPDANRDDPKAEERFKEIQHAYEILSNPERRRQSEEGAWTFDASPRPTITSMDTYEGADTTMIQPPTPVSTYLQPSTPDTKRIS